MKFLNLPKLVFPKDLPQRMAQQQVRPLSICPDCSYVLCSCGNCHSEVCRQSCGYETGAARSEPGADGRVWCSECGGMYLPHVHK